MLTTEDGVRYPTPGSTVWAVHRNPRLWPRADEFLPERWLGRPGDPLYPCKGAWRPFETGSRNCIGQTLALAEIKTVLVMV